MIRSGFRAYSIKRNLESLEGPVNGTLHAYLILARLQEDPQVGLKSGSLDSPHIPFKVQGLLFPVSP